MRNLIYRPKESRDELFLARFHNAANSYIAAHLGERRRFGFVCERKGVELRIGSRRRESFRPKFGRPFEAGIRRNAWLIDRKGRLFHWVRTTIVPTYNQNTIFIGTEDGEESTPLAVVELGFGRPSRVLHRWIVCTRRQRSRPSPKPPRRGYAPSHTGCNGNLRRKNRYVHRSERLFHKHRSHRRRLERQIR